jgi:DNA-binding phage protein
MPARYTFINEDQVVRMLRAEVKQAGGQSDWARRNKVDRTVLNRVLSGQRQMPPSMRKRLKIARTYVRDARPIDEKEAMALLRSEIERAGGPSAWSRKTGIHRTVVSKVLNRRKAITKSVLAALKLERALQPEAPREL